MCDLWRRDFIQGLAAYGVGAFAASGMSSPLLAQAAQNLEPVRRPPADIQPRGEFVLRNAHVITMDPGLGDIPGGFVHVRNGEIVAVGEGINAPEAPAIAGDD